MGVAGYYELLGLERQASLDEVRTAYRELARSLHPDRSGDDSLDSQRTMALVNEAWLVLSDPTTRASYDRSLAAVAAAAVPADVPSSPPAASHSTRRQQWFTGIEAQVRRLTFEAARSASLTLSLRRHGRPRAAYDSLAPGLVDGVGADIETRVRRARELGSAPLDLALTTVLIGLREFAAHLARQVLYDEAAAGTTGEVLLQAEMIDRMWDTIAHELRHDIVQSLGGNPHLHRWLVRR